MWSGECGVEMLAWRLVSGVCSFVDSGLFASGVVSVLWCVRCAVGMWRLRCSWWSACVWCSEAGVVFLVVCMSVD